MTKKLSKHDNFFAKCLEDHTIAKGLFKKYFPPSVQAYVDWEKAELQQLNTKFVDDAGHRYVLCDTLYQVSNNDRDTLLLLHLEHQTKPEKHMPFRAVYYNMGAINQYLHKNPHKTMPAVLSIIYFQNREPYPYSLDLRDSLDPNLPEDIKNLFLKPILINSAEIDDKTLKKDEMSGNFELILKHRVEKPSLANEHLLAEAASRMPRFLRKIALEYTMSRSPFEKESTQEIYSHYFDKEEMMTYERQIKQEAKQELIKNLLLSDLDPEFIAEKAKVDIDFVKKIKETLH